jgi:hypothetical protein
VHPDQIIKGEIPVRTSALRVRGCLRRDRRDKERSSSGKGKGGVDHDAKAGSSSAPSNDYADFIRAEIRRGKSSAEASEHDQSGDRPRMRERAGGHHGDSCVSLQRTGPLYFEQI